MTKDEIRERFRGVKVSVKKADRAPHKPLLILYMLGRCLNGEERVVPYMAVKCDLEDLLRQFRGGSMMGAQVDMWNPFWFLANDKVWELPGAEQEGFSPGKKYTDSAGGKKLREYRKRAKGGLVGEIHDALAADPKFLLEIARGEVLDRHFPWSLHEDILDSVGIGSATSSADAEGAAKGASRKPDFRWKILANYHYRCALCKEEGLALAEHRGTQRVIGLEAAHIRWHSRGGPDIDANGLALCSKHHKYFDSGAFTIGDKGNPLVIRVSGTVHGSESERLRGYHGQHILAPNRKICLPAPEFTRWHHEQVFRQPALETD